MQFSRIDNVAAFERMPAFVTFPTQRQMATLSLRLKCRLRFILQTLYTQPFQTLHSSYILFMNQMMRRK